MSTPAPIQRITDKQPELPQLDETIYETLPDVLKRIYKLGHWPHRQAGPEEVFKDECEQVVRFLCKNLTLPAPTEVPREEAPPRETVDWMKEAAREIHPTRSSGNHRVLNTAAILARHAPSCPESAPATDEAIARDFKAKMIGTLKVGREIGEHEIPEADFEYAAELALRCMVRSTPSPSQDTEATPVVTSRRTKDGTQITIGMKVWCDGEQAEVISFQPEGVEVKIFGHMGDRRCHTEVREADELEVIREDKAGDQS